MTTPDLPAYPAAVLTAIRGGEQGGRLPRPDPVVLGATFPFEGPMSVVRVDEPVLPEPARPDELDASTCGLCTRADEDYLWSNDDWRVIAWRRLGVHSFILESRAHLDLDQLTDELAADLGRQIVRIERAIRTSLDGVGRVHVHRWGDGLAHFHVWFIARPAGLLQLRGSALPVWLDVLPSLPADVWRADLERVAAALAAEPARRSEQGSGS